MKFSPPDYFLDNQPSCSCLKFNPDLPNLLLASDLITGSINLWNFKTRRLLHTISFEDYAKNLQILPTNQGENLDPEKIIGINSIHVDQKFILSWHKNGILLLTEIVNFSDLKKLKFFEWKNFKIKLQHQLVYHSQYFGFCSLEVFKQDDNFYRLLVPENVSNGYSGVKILGLKLNSESLKSFDQKFQAQQMSEIYEKDKGNLMSTIFIKSDQILLGFENGSISLWNIYSQQPIFEVQISKPGSMITKLYLFDKFIYAGSSEDKIFKIDYQKIVNFNENPCRPHEIFRKIQITNAGIHNFLMIQSKKSKTQLPLLVSLGWDKKIRIFDIENENLYQQMQLLACLNNQEDLHYDSPQAMCYSAEHDIFLSGALDGRINVWHKFYQNFLKISK